MSKIAELDYISDEIIYTLARRVIVDSMGEFERVWETANNFCDRYQIKGDPYPHKKAS